MHFWNVGAIEPGVSAKPYLILLMRLALRTTRTHFRCFGLRLLDRISQWLYCDGRCARFGTASFEIDRTFFRSYQESAQRANCRRKKKSGKRPSALHPRQSSIA